jgi:hypothetical protein
MLNSSSRTIKVDDTDPHIVYNGGPWILDDGSESKLGNFGPPYQNTLHGVRKGSGSLSYRFQGEWSWFPSYRSRLSTIIYYRISSNGLWDDEYTQHLRSY